MAGLVEKTTTKIADPALWQKHPELFHYTSAGSFEAINTSQELRATHFQDLNDTTEVFHLRERLKAALMGRFSELILKRQRVSMAFSVKVFDHGGRDKVAASVAEDFTNSLYHVTYGGKAKLEFGAPFITSFSTPGSQYERDHGLLSQWRAYGKGGYCMVFDTAEMARALGTDFDTFFIVHLNIDEAIYSVEEFSIDDRLGALLERCEYFLDQVLSGNRSPKPIEDGFAPFAAATTLFKHHAFREENEVRIVAIPGTQDLADKGKAEYPTEWVDKPIMPVLTFNRDGKDKRYIRLFTVTGDLPFKRLIVGPGADQAERLQRARDILGPDFDITCSDIPFVD
jgi:hypothetical protein